MPKNGNNNCKENHVGYYLISDGIEQLYSELGVHKKSRKEKIINKINLYIYGILITTIVFTIGFEALMCNGIKSAGFNKIVSGIISICLALFAVIPISEIVTKTLQIILSKCVKPKMIPKMDFSLRCTKD